MEDGTASGIIIDGITITDDGSDIMLVNPLPFYAILGGTHATLERRIVCDTQFSYDGDTAILIPANAVCVDYSVIKNGVQRSIRDNTLVGSGSVGLGGLSYLADGKGCQTASLTRFQYESYARAKNTDATKNTPYANSFQLDLNAWFTLLCIKFRTKDLHSASVLEVVFLRMIPILHLQVGELKQEQELRKLTELKLSTTWDLLDSVI